MFRSLLHEWACTAGRCRHSAPVPTSSETTLIELLFCYLQATDLCEDLLFLFFSARLHSHISHYLTVIFHITNQILGECVSEPVEILCRQDTM